MDQQQDDGTSRAAMAAAWIAGQERYAALGLPELPEDPAEAAAMRAAGYEVLCEVAELDGNVVVVLVAADEMPLPVGVSVLSAVFGADPVLGAEFIATLRETAEEGRVLSAFRPLRITG